MTKYAFQGFDVNDEKECLEAVKKDPGSIDFIRDTEMKEKVAKALNIDTSKYDFAFSIKY